MSGLLGAAHAQVLDADVADSLEYVQTGPATVTPYGGAANAFFYARAFAPIGDFDGGTLIYPGSRSPQSFVGYLLFDCCGHAAVGYQSGYLTQAAMEAAYPVGAYTLNSTNSVTMASDWVTVPYAGSVYAAAPPELDAGSFSALASTAAISGLTGNIAPWTPSSDTGGQDFFTVYDDTTHMTVAN